MAGRICKHEGCGRPVNGRGMCKPHYNQWWRRNRDIPTLNKRNDVVLEAMPGTPEQLAEKTGYHLATITIALEQLAGAWKTRKAHIAAWDPPLSLGKNWQPVYRAGRAGHVALTAEMKHQHKLKMRRASALRRGDVAENRIAPPRASWAGALGVGA